MEVSCTLAIMFESNREALEKELMKLVLPKDAHKVEDVVSKYLNSLFENEGKYRQHLTQAEDYILQSVLGLLNAQQGIIRELYTETNDNLPISSIPNKKSILPKEHYSYTLAGTTVGGAVGSILGTWGAIFGAIAGTAIVLYAISQPLLQPQTSVPQSHITQLPIQTKAFLSIVQQICESIDNLMETFRVQVKRIQNAYEQQEKETLSSKYPILINTIENLIKATESTSTDQVEEIKLQADLLKRSLKNYGIYYENGKLIEKI